jgi:hypothetical protein
MKRRNSTTFDSLDEIKSEFIDINNEEEKSQIDKSMQQFPQSNKLRNVKQKVFQGSIFLKNNPTRNLSKLFGRFENESIKSDKENNPGPAKLTEYWNLFKEILKKSKKVSKVTILMKQFIGLLFFSPNCIFKHSFLNKKPLSKSLLKRKRPCFPTRSWGLMKCLWSRSCRRIRKF